MSLSKPHRRLSITQPSAGTPCEAEPDEILEDRAADLELRLAEYEERLAQAEQTIRQLQMQPSALPEAGAVQAPFRVLDARGRPLLEVASHETGACLRLYNADGQPAAMLTAQAEGGGLGVLNQEGTLVATLFVHADGGGLSLRDRDGELVASSFAHRNGGALSLFDSRGNVAAALGATPDGGRLDLNDASGRGAVRVTVRETGGDLALYSRGVSYPYPPVQGLPESKEDAAPTPRRSRERAIREDAARKAVGVYVGAGGGVIETYDRDGSVLSAHGPRNRESSNGHASSGESGRHVRERCPRAA